LNPEKNNGSEDVLTNSNKRLSCEKCPYASYIDGIQSFCGVCHRNIYLEMRRKFKKPKEE